MTANASELAPGFFTTSVKWFQAANNSAIKLKTHTHSEKPMLHSVLLSKMIDSPVGHLHLVASDRGLCAVNFAAGKQKLRTEGIEHSDDNATLMRAEKQLAEYFAGKRKSFDIRLDMRGTIFQLKAWQQLQKIPYGETISYGEQAKRVGDVKKARAVGMANGRNPISIIVPCHRVIGATGAMTGFGGGISTKEFLLKHEASH